MASFVLICIDKPDSLALRMATREKHLAYMAGAPAGFIRLGGPFLTEAGEMCGSLVLAEAESLEAVRAFNAADPYTVAGLFERVEIRPWAARARAALSDNPARPAAGARLCDLAELADPGSRGFLFREGDKLFLGFVVREGAAVRGYEDRCPHAGMPLAMLPNRYLTREGDLILCTSHGALFRPADGLCVGGPCAGKRLTPWPVRVDAGVVSTV